MSDVVVKFVVFFIVQIGRQSLVDLFFEAIVVDEQANVIEDMQQSGKLSVVECVDCQLEGGGFHWVALQDGLKMESHATVGVHHLYLLVDGCELEHGSEGLLVFLDESYNFAVDPPVYSGHIQFFVDRGS